VTTKRTLALTISILVACSIVGTPACRTSNAVHSVTDSNAPHAECLVCKHEGDLACVDVTIVGDTPRTVYDGGTYYFCSEQCRSDFEKHPAEYLAGRR
jgi:hypothetical protein